MPNRTNSNAAVKGNIGKNQKPIAAKQKAKASILMKKIWTAGLLPPLVLKNGGKLPTPKIFLRIIAASLSLKDRFIIQMRRELGQLMK